MKRLLAYLLSFCNVAAVISANISLDLDYLYGGGSENIQIFTGDTVTWRNNSDVPAYVESYTGEWKSSLFFQGQSYSYSFIKPGRYIYSATFYTGNPPQPFGTIIASVLVCAVEGIRPAISIISPPDNFVVNL